MAITFRKDERGRGIVTYSWVDKQGNRQRITKREGQPGYEELKGGGGEAYAQEFGPVTTTRLMSTATTVSTPEPVAERYRQLGAASAMAKLPKNYDDLTPIQQFNAQKRVGLIPQDATFKGMARTAQELEAGERTPKWGYVTGEQQASQRAAVGERIAAQKEQSEYRAVLRKLKPYRQLVDKEPGSHIAAYGYDVDSAIAAGVVTKAEVNKYFKEVPVEPVELDYKALEREYLSLSKPERTLISETALKTSKGITDPFFPIETDYSKLSDKQKREVLEQYVLSETTMHPLGAKVSGVKTTVPKWIGFEQQGWEEAIGLVPVVGTAYYWGDMSPVERAISVAGDVLFIVAPIVGSRVVGALKGLKYLGKAKGARNVDEIIRTGEAALTDIRGGRPLVKVHGQMVRAQAKFADDLLETGRLQRMLREYPLGETRPQVEQSLIRMQQQTALSKARFMNIASKYSNLAAKTIGVDSPMAGETLARLPQQLARSTEQLVNKTLNPRTLKTVTNELRAAEKDLLSVKEVHPDNPKKWSESLSKVMELKAELKTIQVGNLEKLTTDLASVREAIPVLKQQLRALGKASPYYKDLKAALDTAVKRESEMSKQLAEIIKTLDVDYGRGGPLVRGRAGGPSGKPLSGGGDGGRGVATKEVPLLDPAVATQALPGGRGFQIVWVPPSVYPRITPLQQALFTTLAGVRVITKPRPEIEPYVIWPEEEPERPVRLYPVVINLPGPLDALKNLPREELAAALSVAAQAVTQTATGGGVGLTSATITGTTSQPAIGPAPAISPAAKTISVPATEPRTGTTPESPTMQRIVTPAPTTTVTTELPPSTPIPPVSRQVTHSPSTLPIPGGSVAFVMGQRQGPRGIKVPQWYYIPPPYNQNKPIPMSAPPKGADTTGGLSPYTTIQVVGRSRKSRVPETISFDLGIVDGYITNFGRTIEFGGGGLETDVGERLSSPTIGMSIPGFDDYTVNRPTMTGIRRTTRGKSRTGLSKKRPVRKARSSWLDDLTSLKGIRW